MVELMKDNSEKYSEDFLSYMKDYSSFLFDNLDNYDYDEILTYQDEFFQINNNFDRLQYLMSWYDYEINNFCEDCNEAFFATMEDNLKNKYK